MFSGPIHSPPFSWFAAKAGLGYSTKNLSSTLLMLMSITRPLPVMYRNVPIKSADTFSDSLHELSSGNDAKVLILHTNYLSRVDTTTQ